MKEIKYVIKDQVGIHARPAGLLVKQVAEVAPSKVFLQKGDKKVEANRLFSVMSLGVKCNDEVTIIVEGGNEDEALATMKTFFENNL